MEGTFCPGDRLFISPVSLKDIRRGDVIVFQGANLRDMPDEVVVHRVVKVATNGFITRGDANLACDPEPVRIEQVIGKVEMFHRGKRKFHVVVGLKGIYIPRVRRELLWFYHWARKLIKHPYRLLRLSGIIPRIWKPVIRRIYLQTERGRVVKYLYKQKSVGIWDESLQRFECRKPFDLVIPSPLDKGSSS